MISRMLSPAQRPATAGHGRAMDRSPQPSTSSHPAGHGSMMLPSAARPGRFVGSPAPHMAIRARAAATPSFTTAPNHEAFQDVDLEFKQNVMRLRVRHDRVVVEMASSPSSNGMLLEGSEWDILTENRETIDHHANKPSVDPVEGDCVRVWVALKARTNAVAYATVKTFGQKVYVDIRDHWHPNGLEGGIAPTKRGVCLDLGGWLALVREMDTIEEYWRDANDYLRLQSAIATNPSTLVDTSDEDSQLVVLDD